MKIFVIQFLLTISMTVYAQTWQWAKSAGGSSSDYGDFITADARGNVYAAGTFGSTSIQFGNTPPLFNTLTQSSNNFFLVKYDSLGNILWAKGISRGVLLGMAKDLNSNIYLIGHFWDTIKFQNTPTLIGNGMEDIFLAKFDSSGNTIWTRSAGGTSDDDVAGITTDSNGNVYITGWFRSDSIQFGNTQPLKLLYGPGISNFGFIVKYDPLGNAVWAINPQGQCYPNCIVTDNNNNLNMAGVFGDSLIFRRNPLIKVVSKNNYHSGDVFISRYDSSGNALWAGSAGGTLNDKITGIVTDSESNVYLTGYYLSDSIQFGSTPFLINTSPNYTKIFIAKYNINGKALWAHTVYGDNNYPSAIVLGSNFDLWLTGYFYGPIIQFGNLPWLNNHVYSQGPFADIFLTKYDTAGIAQISLSIGGYGEEEAACIASDKVGNIYITGNFAYSYPFQFGSLPPFVNQGHMDYFIAKYDPLTNIFENGVDNKFIIFPNPVKSNFCVKVCFETKYIQINNLFGQIVQRRNVHNETEINFEIINNGIYFVQIVTDKETITKKVVINK